MKKFLKLLRRMKLRSPKVKEKHSKLNVIKRTFILFKRFLCIIAFSLLFVLSCFELFIRIILYPIVYIITGYNTVNIDKGLWTHKLMIYIMYEIY